MLPITSKLTVQFGEETESLACAGGDLESDETRQAGGIESVQVYVLSICGPSERNMHTPFHPSFVSATPCRLRRLV